MITDGVIGTTNFRELIISDFSKSINHLIKIFSNHIEDYKKFSEEAQKTIIDYLLINNKKDKEKLINAASNTYEKTLVEFDIYSNIINEKTLNENIEKEKQAKERE